MDCAFSAPFPQVRNPWYEIRGPSKSPRSLGPSFCANLRMRNKDDLLIIGAGVLGSLVGKEWKQMHPNSRVIGETLTERSHEKLAESGIEPMLSGEAPASEFSRVVLSASPEYSNEYSEEVAKTVERIPTDATLIFTSSGGVYAPREIVREDSSLWDSKRAKSLLDAESAAMKHDGPVVIMRFGALYRTWNGVHNYWMRTGKINARSDTLINLVHYEDAARAVTAALALGRGAANFDKPFLVADGHPKSILHICKTAQLFDYYKGFNLPICNEEAQDTSKTFDCSWTRSMLDWAPQKPPFDEFIAMEAGRVNAAFAKGILKA